MIYNRSYKVKSIDVVHLTWQPQTQCASNKQAKSIQQTWQERPKLKWMNHKYEKATTVHTLRDVLYVSPPSQQISQKQDRVSNKCEVCKCPGG